MNRFQNIIAQTVLPVTHPQLIHLLPVGSVATLLDCVESGVMVQQVQDLQNFIH